MKSVIAIMLTKDRPSMAARAVRAWSEQSFHKDFPCSLRLLIYDTGFVPFNLSAEALGVEARYSDGHTGVMYQRGCVSDSIGASRNKAAAYAAESHYGFKPHDILIHWDDDDWSHPNRIAEQVAHLQASGADAVGYSEMLFWRDGLSVQSVKVDAAEIKKVGVYLPGPYEGQAWLYTKGPLAAPPGTSLCLWRKAWERKPFPDTSQAEDQKWCQGLNVASVSSLNAPFPAEPRIIASIHGANTASYDLEGIIECGGEQNWRRVHAFPKAVSEWDSYCRERMKL